MKIVVGIPTAGRPDILTAALDHLARQNRPPDSIVVCPAGDDDVEPETAARYADLVRVVRAPPGATRQRNAIVRSVPDADVIVFFDDDFFPQQDFLAETERLFVETPDLVMATGKVIADGIAGPGFTVAQALAYLADDPGCPAQTRLAPVYNAYGCNMAIRLAPMRRNGVLFDETLPLYAWWEDVDLSRRLAPYGLIAASERLRGVHMGSKRGRVPGRRLGYSQIANIVYLIRKGSVSPRVGLPMMAKNLAANLVRSLRPEAWVDRRGRLMGNCLAIRDVVRGVDSPLNILRMD